MKTENQISDYFKSQIVLFFNGLLNNDEEKELHRWVGMQSQNKEIFEEYRDIWLAGLSSEQPCENLELAWGKISKTISEKRRNDSVAVKLPPLKRWFNHRVQIAAAMLMLFGLGVITGHLGWSRSKKVGGCEISTPLGARSNVVLPDGTEVSLNAGSKIWYNGDYNNKERKIFLDGEAFFKVKHDKERPFKVQTTYMVVRALGTSFNVKAYVDDYTATTTLVEGMVKIYSSESIGKKFEYILKPRQSLSVITKEVNITDNVVSKAPTPVSEKIVFADLVRTELFTSWKDDRWYIKGETLDNFAVLLRRRFNVEVHFQSESIKQYKFSGTIEQETVEQVLEILRLTLPIKCRIGKGEVWIDSDSELIKQYHHL